jgi:hypothetical protein
VARSSRSRNTAISTSYDKEKFAAQNGSASCVGLLGWRLRERGAHAVESASTKDTAEIQAIALQEMTKSQ